MVSSKLSQTLGVFLRIREFVPFSVLRSLYNTMIYPYISYTIEAWYNAPKTVINSVEVLQRKIIRCVNFLDTRERTDSYFKQANLLPIKSIFEFKISLHDPLYDPLLLTKLRTFQDQHGHFTRTRDSYVIPRFKRKRTNAHIHCSCITLWNQIPDNVKQASTPTSFRTVW